ncbi:helix-turn-helix transcriptional regulator [Vibrio panuliri]|uniref:Transcriptional regulator n=1 Tax=Vibrio panuliri TaxID=1381081 RepID=A0ABX3FN29_9VIBR|nr:helix-turn-helix transcriptional regulator [Vibrio panuliri]KAB1457930.1 helix-turn-helix transcriptional regulator [Vibrio panuliri]OLQ95631.1 transcriptional regulator [Vibrio panuliri]
MIDPIVQVIISRRKLSKLTRQQMADIAGMSLKTYQRIERGESDMKMSQYRSILRTLNLTDLDIALDVKEIQPFTNADLVAAARLLSPEAQALLVRFIMNVSK